VDAMSKITDLIFKGEPHYITQNFRSGHKATDYGTNRKKINQYAIMDGTVTWVGKISGGNAFRIFYPKINKEFLHIHLDKVYVKKGQKVNKDTVLGTTGMTGIATGIHLHLAIKDLNTNQYIDPEVYAKTFDDAENSDGHIYYVVQKGDNLTKIAKKYGTTWREIYNKNKDIIGSEPNRIYPNQRLLIK